MLKKCLILVTIINITSAAAVLAEDIPKNTKAIYFQPSDIIGILEKTPWRFKEVIDEYGDPKFLLKIDDYEASLWTTGCKTDFCKDIRLYSYIKFDGNGPDPKRINHWNQWQRWTKAYIDDDNDAVLEAEIDLKDGATIEAIHTLFATYSSHLHKFTKKMKK